MNKSENINELSVALTKVQAELLGAKKDVKNGFFKSNYADLESCWEAARAPLAKHGLSVCQVTGRDEHGIYLETVLTHTSGQWISGQMPVLLVKQDPQALGSAITYARRYSLAAIIGLVQTDDDGEAAIGRVSAQATPEPKYPKQVVFENGPGVQAAPVAVALGAPVEEAPKARPAKPVFSKPAANGKAW